MPVCASSLRTFMNNAGYFIGELHKVLFALSPAKYQSFSRLAMKKSSVGSPAEYHRAAFGACAGGCRIRE
jgi:hypothetical protein